MKCRICYNESDNQAVEVREMMFGLRDVFRYFQCSKCQCLQIEDIPQEMTKYYPDNYYSYSYPQISKNIIKKFLIKSRDNYVVFGKGLIGKILFSKFPRDDFRFLNSLTINKGTSILDVGCGAGALLYSLREIGMKKLLGIDPYNNENIEYGNGLLIQKKKIQEVNSNWDVVMFHHSFEHIPDPFETLQAVAERLTPDGYCIIRIPIVSSYAWEHYGVNWVQIDAPRHIFLHSLKSLNILANKCGLKLCDVVYDSTAFQFWGSEQYIKDIPLRDERSYSENPNASLFSESEISAFANDAIQLNASKEGDQAIFYFRKL